MDAALDCVFLADEFGRIVEFNASAERVFGYTRREALGRPLVELVVPPSLRDRHKAGFANFVRTREGHLIGRRVELTAMRSDGSEFPAELGLSQLDGEPLLVCGAVRDLTETKRAEEELRRVAHEQQVLQRVATLVASGLGLEHVFDAVAAEVGGLVGAANVKVIQYTSGERDLTVADWSREGAQLSPAMRSSALTEEIHNPSDRDNGTVKLGAVGSSLEEARPIEGPPANRKVTVSIVVDGAAWGAILVEADRIPASAAAGVSNLANLTALAVANATAKAQLLASRARIVAAGDEARRRLKRDIHDGAQQRLVTSLIQLQLADERIESDPEAAHRALRAAMEFSRKGLDELRDLASGLHPSVLTAGGLGAALDALAETSALPVAVDAPDARYAPETEVAIYFLVGEALANVGKHSRASRAEVLVVEDATNLTVTVRDDGVGGALLDAGSGLRGLEDRVAALGGSFTVQSTPGAGTLVRATLPIQRTEHVR